MAPWLVSLAASALEAKKRRDEQNRARQMAQGRMAGGLSAELGYPQYGVQAQGLESDIDEQNRRKMPLAALAPYLFGGG